MRLATVCFLVAVGSLRCSPLTELFVIVDSDLETGARVDAVRITVEGSGETLTREGPLGTGGWPATLGVQAGEDDQATVTITATALKAGAVIGATTVRAQFVPDESRVVPVAICAECLGRTCPAGQRCEHGACVDALLPPAGLPAFGSEVRAQCGNDRGGPGAEASADGGAPDGPAGDGARDGPPVGPGCKGALDCERVVFVTSEGATGNLGGLAGADARCQRLADLSPLPRVNGRTFRAWLSTASSIEPVHAADRLPHGTKPYVLTDGTRIAADWASLVDGSLDAAISRDERGQLLQEGSPPVWTATTPSGLAFVQDSVRVDCAGWTTSATSGRLGLATATNEGWTSLLAARCDVPAFLYCIEL